jgi:hypothetical protein
MNNHSAVCLEWFVLARVVVHDVPLQVTVQQADKQPNEQAGTSARQDD